MVFSACKSLKHFFLAGLIPLFKLVLLQLIVFMQVSVCLTFNMWLMSFDLLNALDRGLEILTCEHWQKQNNL